MVERSLSGRFYYLSVLCIGLFIFSGCEKQSVSVYTVPKETLTQNLPQANKTDHDHPALEWEAPTQWAQQPETAMRLAGFKVKSKKNTVDITIVTLSGEAGSLLANINRWRGQIELAPITEIEAEQSVHEYKTSKQTFKRIFIQNTQTKKAIDVSILQLGADTYFFKAMGSLDDVMAVKSELDRFLDTVKPHEHH